MSHENQSSFVLSPSPLFFSFLFSPAFIIIIIIIYRTKMQLKVTTLTMYFNNVVKDLTLTCNYDFM